MEKHCREFAKQAEGYDLYAGFNNEVVTADSVRLGTNAIFAPNGRIGEGRRRRIHRSKIREF